MVSNLNDRLGKLKEMYLSTKGVNGEIKKFFRGSIVFINSLKFYSLTTKKQQTILKSMGLKMMTSGSKKFILPGIYFN
jgi:hypothetical protein